jgi:hypothetical protein
VQPPPVLGELAAIEPLRQAIRRLGPAEGGYDQTAEKVIDELGMILHQDVQLIGIPRREYDTALGHALFFRIQPVRELDRREGMARAQHEAVGLSRPRPL